MPFSPEKSVFTYRRIKKERKVVDKVTAIRWVSANTPREAFVNEYFMQKRVGVWSENRDLIDKTYNKIWSPGRKYYGNK